MEKISAGTLDERPTLSGAELREAFIASGAWLDRHVDAINALNVFPVPDGDTGLNMSLTLRSALEQLQSAGASSVGEVTEAVARGALLGARGNSGVILAQLLRGIARTLRGQETADGKLLAQALADGAEAAYTAVANPVEGTILTVARGAGRAAQKAAADSLGPLSILEHAHRGAQAAVAETPDQLPILKQASVVDSGGEGYRVVLEGLLRSLRGEPMDESPIAVTTRVDFSALHQDADDFYGYCTEVLFQGTDLDAGAVRTRLNELGSSVLVVGDTEMLKVHVHTLRPGAVLDLATDLGEIVKVKIDNMQLQHLEFAGAPKQPAAAELGGTSIVAVALGAGFEEIFASLGAVVVRGGQTMNPSVGEIAAAVEKTTRAEVIILPNDRNVLMAAEQAAQGFDARKVAVLPTESIPQGIAAAVAHNPEADADTNVSALTEAASRCHCIELTRAVRASRLEGVAIDAGAPLAILDRDPVSSGASFEDTLRGAIDRLPRRDYELVTIYLGSEGTAEDASSLADIIRQQTGLPVEIASGGQPNYPYIISVE